MTTKPLFREDAYARSTTALVVSHTEDGGIVPDVSVFYPTGGGQPGDSGHLHWDNGDVAITTTRKIEKDGIALIPSAGVALPPVGTEITMTLDWSRRYRLMRVHTALHLLSVAVPFGVTGGSIGEEKGRLDFDMADPPEDKDQITAALNTLIATNANVRESWITEAELDAQPDLVKTLSVQPPRGAGRIRLIRIGEVQTPVDLQPCGGTHVAQLGEIGPVRIGKVEKKGRMNRRVYLHLTD